MTFKREDRYLVLKWDDIEKYLSAYTREWIMEAILDITFGRLKDGKDPSPKFVCVKSTYPEYEYVWKCIEERVTKKEQEQNDN